MNKVTLKVCMRRGIEMLGLERPKVNVCASVSKCALGPERERERESMSSCPHERKRERVGERSLVFNLLEWLKA